MANIVPVLVTLTFMRSIMKMDLLQATPQFEFESNDKLKSHILEKHVCKMIENNNEQLKATVNSKEHEEKNKLCDIQRTVTVALKSLAPVCLQAENRVSLKTITTSNNNATNGKFLLCRILCPPLITTDAFVTIVDDPEGELNVSIEFRIALLHIKEYLTVGTIFAIKNPCFTNTEDEDPIFRCNNPMEVVVLNQSTLDELFPDLQWNAKLPKVFEQNGNAILDNATNYKRIGDEHLVFKEYKHAITAYTNAIKVGDKSIDVLCNRSACYLAVSNYDAGLLDAEAALDIDKIYVKAICRKVKALFGLEWYEEAMDFLEKLSLDSIPHAKRNNIIDLIAKAKSFIAQSQYGEYPWADLYHRQSTYLDFAEYKKAVTIKEAPMKGRGLFAKKMIESGELIVSSKAFAYIEHDTSVEVISNNNLGTERVSGKNNKQLALHIEQILTDNLEKSKDFFSLYAGSDLGYMCECECDEAASNDFLIDMERIEGICAHNAFENGLSFNESFHQEVIPNYSGLWIVPSFINHTCVDANSTCLKIGDFLFVIAFKDIAEGEEILFSYAPPYANFPENQFSRYDFICKCRLCERDIADNETMKDYRADLYFQLANILGEYKMTGEYIQKRDENEIFRTLKLLKETRNDAPELNLLLGQSLLEFGMILLRSKQFMKSANIFEDFYQMTKNVAFFSRSALTACVNIVTIYISAGEILKAESWVEVVKKRTILTYKSLDYLHVHFPLTVESMRVYGFDV